MKLPRKVTALATALLLSCAATAALAQHDDPHGNVPVTGTKPDPHQGTNDAPHGTENGAEHNPEHEAAGHHGPAPINWTDIGDKSRPAFFALVVNFGLLFALYYALGKKPIVAGLKQRRVDIGKDIDEASKMLAEAEARAEKYGAKEKNVDVDAATAKASIVASGKGEVEHQLSEAEEKSLRMKRDADRLVEQEAKQLQQDLLVATIEKAVAEAHKILEKTTTSEDHARLANELLAELARKPGVPRKAGSVAPPRTAGGTT